MINHALMSGSEMGHEAVLALMTQRIPDTVRYFQCRLLERHPDPETVARGVCWASWDATEELMRIFAAYPRSCVTANEFHRHHQRALQRSLEAWRVGVEGGSVPPFTIVEVLRQRFTRWRFGHASPVPLRRLWATIASWAGLFIS